MRGHEIDAALVSLSSLACAVLAAERSAAADVAYTAAPLRLKPVARSTGAETQGTVQGSAAAAVAATVDAALRQGLLLLLLRRRRWRRRRVPAELRRPLVHALRPSTSAPRSSRIAASTATLLPASEPLLQLLLCPGRPPAAPHRACCPLPKRTQNRPTHPQRQQRAPPLPRPPLQPPQS
eukprot:TRINITY_DN2072_c0_g1_i4.p2 TRINITY_DN2072_c0_g1~~TRINITY_DN2072_c0_g1_i4.p2  ORF type:complete len:180 (-),score=36.28 TRINITY_DN2072_c0_g1_i4:479-1018(-)